MVRQAHELSPADPFIVDSLGWVEYRMGHFDAAATLLAQAYSSRKDTEIAAHLGEALWADGKHDEAAARAARRAQARRRQRGAQADDDAVEGRAVSRSKGWRLRVPGRPGAVAALALAACSGLRHAIRRRCPATSTPASSRCAPTRRPTSPRAPSAASSS